MNAFSILSVFGCFAVIVVLMNCLAYGWPEWLE